ncbi:MbtH family protein [Streptomyces sp. NPDC101160]|uniref:MbtH family protein n=1 Tax=Streptomyces sp. NPDC101160 TaxID=3366118 RepID=UPI00382C9AFD
MQDASAGVDERFVVVVNDEEQYSLWAEQRELPAGWRAAGFAGTKAECLAHVEEVWTDQRPLSVRQNAAA